MKEDPEALKEVMAVLTEDIATLAKAVITDGHADGVYLSVQNIPHPDMTEEKYKEFITPSEVVVLRRRILCPTTTFFIFAAIWAATMI